MEPNTISFSSKPQLPTLHRSTTLLPSASLRQIRRQFIGFSHNLRPPGAFRLNQLHKSGRLQVHSPRFIVRASFDSNLVLVVVAMTSFSAAWFASCNRRYRKNESSKEVSGSPSRSSSQEGTNDVNQFLDRQILDNGELQVAIYAKEDGDLAEKMREDTDDSENKEVSLQFQESTSMTNSILTKSSESLKCLESNSSNFVVSEEIKSSGLIFGPPEPSAVHPIMFATEMSELNLEKDQKENEFHPDLCRLTVDTESLSSPDFLDDAHGVVSGGSTLHTTLLGEAEVTSFHDIIKESVGKDLYTFYEANQSAQKSPTNLNVLQPISSHAFVPNSNSFSVLKRKIEAKESFSKKEVKGSELSVQNPLQTADTIQEKISFSNFKGGSPGKRKDLGRSRGFQRENERRHLIQETDNNLSQFHYPNGIHVDGKRHPQQQLSAYNSLLRDGRLTDCVDLLEDMDRRGLLNMEKVYHAKFFKTCKNRKAVKEAFRFTRLIPNPTLSTFNMLMSVCTNSQDLEGAFQVFQLVQMAGLKADCKLYTTLISTCAKSGQVDTMFEVFHEMVNSGVEPNVHTYGALIDGCARAGQVAKAFGAYGIMRSKNVKPDRVVFNALITACGQSGAVDRAFDVLAEMSAETHPIDPDHVTVGALIKACANAGQVDRAREVYKMIHEYNIKGTPELYTIAVNCCSQTGDWQFAISVYSDMKSKGVVPDEVFISALIDFAGHAGQLDAAFEILQEARKQGINIGIVSYSSLMGACSNAKNWQKALELYEQIKSIKLNLAVSTMNALITSLCEGDQLPKALDILSEMKRLGLCPNTITYSILLVASEKKDDLEVGLMLLSQAKEDGIAPNLIMSRCIIGMCLRRFEKAWMVGEPVLSFNSGQPQIENRWSSLALMVYRETIVAGTIPTMEVVSQILGCLQFPRDISLKDRFVGNLGFGEYDPRAFSLLEEAASFGVVPCVSFKESPIVVDARELHIRIAEVYLLTVLKCLKHRLAAGAKLPSITILLPSEKAQVISSKGEKAVNLAGRIGQEIASLLRRIGLTYQGNESYGKIRISGVKLKRWFQPKLSSFSGKPGEWSSSQWRLGKGIAHQQRSIRTGNLSLE
ncbi:hypothetical protein SLE2022_200280 [Rubroshorea leprosula]